MTSFPSPCSFPSLYKGDHDDTWSGVVMTSRIPLLITTPRVLHAHWQQTLLLPSLGISALSYLPLLADWASKDPPHTLMVHLALTQPRPCPSPDTPPGSPTQYPLPANVLLSQTFLPLSSEVETR